MGIFDKPQFAMRNSFKHLKPCTEFSDKRIESSLFVRNAQDDNNEYPDFDVAP